MSSGRHWWSLRRLVMATSPIGSQRFSLLPRANTHHILQASHMLILLA